jgi:hypothetical protein
MSRSSYSVATFAFRLGQSPYRPMCLRILFLSFPQLCFSDRAVHILCSSLFPTIQADAPVVVSDSRRCLESNTSHGSPKIPVFRQTKIIFLSVRMFMTSDGHVVRWSTNHQGVINIHEMLLMTCDIAIKQLHGYVYKLVSG